MTAPDRLLAVQELEAMTHDESVALVRRSIVTDLDELPAHVREEIGAEGRRLAAAIMPKEDLSDSALRAAR